LLTLHLLGVQTLLETTLGQSVVAGIELERGEGFFHYVSVDLDSGLQVVQLVVTSIPLKDFGTNPFVGGEELQLHLFSTQFCKYFIDLRNFCALHEFTLKVSYAIPQEHNPVDRSLVVLLPVEYSLLQDFFEL